MIGIISRTRSSNPYIVSLDELKSADIKSAIIYGAKVLLIEETLLREAHHFIPVDFVPMYDIENDENYSDLYLAAICKRNFSVKNHEIELGTFRDKTTYNTMDDITSYWTKAIKEHSWAQEITWRICRIQELFLEDENNTTVKKLKQDIEKRLPLDDGLKEKIQTYCNSLTGIALPSILRLLQNGLDEEVRKNKKKTTLNNGFDKTDFEVRHVMLTYQHRMIPEISCFSNKHIYDGKLKDGSEMEKKRVWSCSVFSHHDLWLNTDSIVKNNYTNENPDEIRIIKQKLHEFINWTKNNPNPDKDSNGNWTVACLTYYKRQENNLKKAIKELFNEDRGSTHYCDDNRHIEVFIYTVDKFQGREADVVFLSFVKSGDVSLGFMDSRNRLNVALTRAKFQRIIVGSKKYFRNPKKSRLLKELVCDVKIEEYK